MDKFEEIKKFKELADAGIITEEEFEKKKTELLEKQEPSASKVLDGFISGAKEKKDQAKAAASEKLEEMKKKQAEEAENRKKEEEERKEKEAELAQKRKEEEEKEKQRIAEEKKRLAEEKQREREEKKAQAKKKRKEFFAKKSVKAAIGVCCALIVAFIGFSIYSYVTRDTLKDDFNETTAYKLHDLEYEVPSNWTADKDGVITADQPAEESAAYVRYDKKTGKPLAAVLYQYYGDDRNLQTVIKNKVGSDGWQEFTLSGAPNGVKAYKKQEEEQTAYVTFAEADYSTFVNCLLVSNQVLDDNVVNSILNSPKYETYKNKAEIEDLSVQYYGSNEDGYTAKPEDFVVRIKYKGKDPKAINSFEIEPSSPVVHSGETTAVTVKSHGKEKSIELKGKQVKKITASYSGDTEEGVKIAKGNKDLTVTVKWDDGTEETITDYEMDGTITLKAGETGEAVIKAYGKETTLKVECTTLSEAQFKEKCETRGYKDLLRKASYAEYTKIYGKVVQDCGSGYYRITSGGSRWDDVYMVTVLSDDKLVEDDWVTCYGVTSGIYSYETVMGATQKVPWLMAKYVELD